MSRIALLVLILAPMPARAVTMRWSPVGNPGNANDLNTGFGAVAYSYNIGTYDVTNSQYAEFLNTKDPTGANSLGLYNTNMANVFYGGINFNAGNLLGSKYTLVSGAQNHPVNFVTWYDTIRFANWLNNGQGSGDTESGAYTLLGGTPEPSNAASITRNAGATVFLPNENEWYKAAYFNPADSSYFLYPTSSNLLPMATAPTTAPNSANWDSVVGNPTDVGAYSGTMSPYGAFDMGGNVYQWNETLMTGPFFTSLFRGLRGGAFYSSFPIEMQPSNRFKAYGPGIEDNGVGFRLAETPEPSSLVLAALGFIGLAAYGVVRAFLAIRSRPV